jgi:uncharacterized protein with PIN domain
VEFLLYGMVVTFILGSAIYFGLSDRTPRCHHCRKLALMLSRQIPESSPPVFELVYRCPSCREILWRRFVSLIGD